MSGKKKDNFLGLFTKISFGNESEDTGTSLSMPSYMYIPLEKHVIDKFKRIFKIVNAAEKLSPHGLIMVEVHFRDIILCCPSIGEKIINECFSNDEKERFNEDKFIIIDNRRIKEYVVEMENYERENYLNDILLTSIRVNDVCFYFSVHYFDQHSNIETTLLSITIPNYIFNGIVFDKI